ncbi:MAG: RHS repeat-associated core domain-containing protein [Sphingobacteriales bacterium]|nr:MAG: RHS repeat-associated core domain-containing protein [Sphingobacteriales bacterium]
MNRLTDAEYLKVYNGTAQYTGMYDESLQYYKNGNIRTLQRYGDYDDEDLLQPLRIDNLTYTYGDATKPNKLTRVSDTDGPSGFKDISGAAPDEYIYDANGNMTKDVHKSIWNTPITYNHLNLPMKLTFNSGSYIEYIYDATGKKVSKTVYDSSNTSTTTTEYLDGFQYKNTIMELFATKEGYVTVTNRALPESTPSYRHSYAFNYVDHLGNVRLTFGLNGAKVRILAENNYYPFGLKHKNYNVTQQQYQESNGEIDLVTCTSCDYKYKYNGKEWQDELGLNFYDYGARNYDPAIGRWMNIDPLAEKSRRFSPYTYALNNPVYFIDPDGMEAVESMDKLNNNDVEVSVDIGYGRSVNPNNFAGSMSYSGAQLRLTNSGQTKFQIAELKDNMAAAGFTDDFTQLFKTGKNGKPTIDPNGKPDFSQILTNFSPRAKQREKLKSMPQEGAVFGA